MSFIKLIKAAVLLLCVVSAGMAQQKNVLVFSKTAGYRHSSIEPGIAFFKRIATGEQLNFTFSEDAAIINESDLKKFHAVVFLNTTGDILDDIQQADFERYIQAGGGFVGIHAAADCEYGWTWYNKLVGGWFASHPGGEVSNVQEGKMDVHNGSHPSTSHLAKTFSRKDEFYDFRSLQVKREDVLISVDENSYKQGKMGDWHPMAWAHEFDGGKVFYTNFGHVESTFETETDMQKHIIEGLKSVLADKLDYSKAYSLRPPEENRFLKTVLANNLFEPTELVAMPNGKIMVVERRGDVKVWLPVKEEFKTANHLDVFSSYEYGLMGVGIDPGFEQNNFVYLYYTPNTETHKENYLSRFTYDQSKDELVVSSEKVLLKVAIKGNDCCHTGGSIDWDAQGNLYLSTGDDTNPFASDGFGPMDFQPGREGWDAMSTSANTNDLRGKILRIKPEPDGTYRIPKGNLFAHGTPNTRPEIFVMGCRNPYRIGVDKRTGHLYWGDIGPDAGKPNPDRGPEGYVEFNRTTEAGFFGWPMIVGNNYAYRRYDFATKVSGEKYDVNKPVNDSPNNTGLRDLPAAKTPFIYYSYGESAEFPMVGTGGCNPMAGPVYYSGDYQESEHKFPAYFDGKFFAYEWMRDWILLVSFDENGQVSKTEPFMPNTKFYHPMDVTFSKDGVMYMLEYGPKWSAQNEEAALSKIEYIPNNRPPVVRIKADKTLGAAPMKVTFSSEGSMDYDGDNLTYSWDFGGGAKNSKLTNPGVIFKKPGEYKVTLKVTDAAGNTSKESMFLKVGNEVPEVSISVNGNKTFYLGEESIDYAVSVTDKEDGTIGNGIKPEEVVVSINYLEGYDKNAVTVGHQRNMAYANGRRLIDKSDCMACHQVEEKSIGPSFKKIAGKYPLNKKNTDLLAEKIIAGGGGVWGEVAMAAHPDIKLEVAQSMVQYILSINNEEARPLPASGKFLASEHKGKKDGAYIIQASYEDKGGKVIGTQTGSSSLALRSPHVPATAYDETQGTMKFDVPQIGELVVASNDTWVMFDDIDFTGIGGVKIGAFSQKSQTSGGNVELRLDSPDGQLMGQVTIPEMSMAPQTITFNDKINDRRKLYLVFKNPDAEGKPLFGLTFLEFFR